MTWREGDGPVRAGKLVLGSSGLRLEGGVARGRLSARRILYGDLTGVESARQPAKRIGGRPTLVLKRSGHAPLAITSVDNPGCLHELAERLRLAISGAVR
ncbi:MAG: hypothetical protein ACRDM9_06525 [Gaiellaceae bacterium]